MPVIPRIDGDPSSTLSYLNALNRIHWALGLMGFDELRKGGQEDMVHAILRGDDCLGIMPTSGGKSAVYILPTLCWGWRTMVFSPLIALQKDQVEKLQQRGIPAEKINSNNTPAENLSAAREWMNKQLNFLFVAPERLNNESFLEMCRHSPPDFIVVDEAHSASMWAEDFRPAYKKIAPFIESTKPKVVLACTATAPPDVETEIRRILHLEDAEKILFNPRRENLRFIARDKRQWDEVAHILNKEVKGSCIIYCSAVKRCEEGYEYLKDKIEGGIDIYTGKLAPSKREMVQNLFMNDDTRCMIATNAFGMGVDKPNIRGIVHYDIPGSVDSYVQEAGRGGRDGQPSKCILLWGQDSLRTQNFFLDNKNPQPAEILKVFDYLLIESGKQSSDRLELSAKDIGFAIGMMDVKVDSILTVLTANQVLERKGMDQDFAKVILHGTGHPDAKLEKVLQSIMRMGFKEADGYVHFDVDNLATACSVTPPTVKKYLHGLEEGKYIKYVPPFSGRTIQLLVRDQAGLEAKIDWKRLRRKREYEEWKLAQITQYATSVKDDDRPKFLEDYFKRSMEF